MNGTLGGVLRCTFEQQWQVPNGSRKIGACDKTMIELLNKEANTHGII
ncbi:hypothetical protein PAECIP111802_00262 [Paenibacillus allorhizosphaerae]|uniref:Uncharacterized protein n=1 Tax=Paenibacillus allorhizosphaerae TaxID=2849866 RepID=A0ABM8VAD6_9BACL|nr:hypothetical protein PAECIP111802_00262 [Paenibacillus allorhizosphaerae]